MSNRQVNKNSLMSLMTYSAYLLKQQRQTHTHKSSSLSVSATAATIESHEWMEHCVYCLFICHSSSKRDIKRRKKNTLFESSALRFVFLSRFVNVDLSFTPSLLHFAQISMKSNHFMRDFCFSFNFFEASPNLINSRINFFACNLPLRATRIRLNEIKLSIETFSLQLFNA